MSQEFSYLWTEMKPEIIDLTGCPREKMWDELYSKVIRLFGPNKYSSNQLEIAGIHCFLSDRMTIKNRREKNYREQSRKIIFSFEGKWMRLYLENSYHPETGSFARRTWMIETNSEEFVENALVILTVAL